MYSNTQTLNSDKKMGIKIAVAVWAFLDAIGLTAAIILLINLEAIERAILFVATLAFIGYRLWHLHLDGDRKKEETKKLKLENELLIKKLASIE